MMIVCVMYRRCVGFGYEVNIDRSLDVFASLSMTTISSKQTVARHVIVTEYTRLLMFASYSMTTT